MNLVLDSRLYPLAFHNYPSRLSFLSPLHNFWTWIALLTGTAALSFWKIRASASASPKPQLPTPPSSTSPICDAASLSHTLRQRLLKSSAPAPLDVDGATRGKFTAYYICDDFDSHSQCRTEEEETSLPSPSPSLSSLSLSSSSDEWWENWEKLLRMRMGESKNGWYMHLDLTELNGNVVRLWDPPSIPSFAAESTFAFASSRSVLR